MIKSTLPFLVLLVVAVFVCFREPGIRWRWLLLMIPVVVFLGLAMHSDMNIGVRHILPIYPFLYVVGASALSVLIGRDRKWMAAAAVLLIFQIVTCCEVSLAILLMRMRRGVGKGMCIIG